jgi:hypothetical protein
MCECHREFTKVSEVIIKGTQTTKQDIKLATSHHGNLFSRLSEQVSFQHETLCPLNFFFFCFVLFWFGFIGLSFSAGRTMLQLEFHDQEFLL